MNTWSKWTHYQNGNYHIFLSLIDGTKIRMTPKDKFCGDFPESMDVKITNQCDMACPFCHEDSKAEGLHASFDSRWLDSLHAGQEIALGGGNVLSHPKFVELLELLHKKRCVPSITLNQVHFLKNFDFVKSLYEQELVYGVGVSLVKPTDELTRRMQEIPTSVLHTICGIFDEKSFNELKHKKLKLLVLGYKNFRRGETFLTSNEDKIQKNINWLRQNLNTVFDSFEVTSFDNLALEQLRVQSMISPAWWQEHYMGDEGSHTFYIDAVKDEYALTSATPMRFPIGNKTVPQMFQDIKSRYNTI